MVYTTSRAPHPFGRDMLSICYSGAMNNGMDRTYIKDLKSAVGQEVSISGWVDVRRDQGKMVFFEFRDMTGKIQGVVLPSYKEALEACKEIRPEWVVRVAAKVNKR